MIDRMPNPLPRLLLEVAERIDFDPVFRRAVARDPLVALTGAGLDTATAVDLVGEAEVVPFQDGPSQVAARAHRWALALLREGQ